MQTFYSLDAFAKSQFFQNYVTFGKFEPLHLGHLELLKNLRQWASSKNTVLLSFSNNPQAFLQQKTEPLPLLPLNIREQILDHLGISAFVCIPFDSSFSSISPYDFVQKILVEQLHAEAVLFGFNSRFGYQGKGDFALLTQLAPTFHFQAREFPPYTLENEIVSSFRIRTLLEHGELVKANQFLGKPYTLYGEVIQGQQLGRTLNFPTANLKTNQFLPKKGVYGVQVFWPEKTPSPYLGVMNIGQRPTLSEEAPLSVEIHVLDFDDDLYGEKIEVQLIQYIREEKKFSSLEDLKQQIHQDIEQYQEFLKKIQFLS